ncbi:MAG: metal-dependent hydrolase [Nanoarchaeota archaeon]|nr:metal-dependent hydrolase [Nanoarchaeota archaeon]MBU4124357.1 metal-dependent hydrolase [Nanoarchaeota archaeon]
MQKYTHLIFALLVFLLLNYILHFPLYLALFAFVGAMFPDLDLKFGKLHRKLLHNVWVLLIILFVLFRTGLIDNIFAIVFSIGFVSHLVLDGLTVSGIYPFWPIEKFRIRGSAKTGKASEYLIFVIILFMVLLISGILKVYLF